MSLLSAVQAIGKDLLESRHWPARPESINFEITAACDARCIHCPRLDMDRPMKAMPMDLFRRMVDQASDLKVSQLCPNGYGEICTIPMRLLEPYFEYISSKPWPFKVVVRPFDKADGAKEWEMPANHLSLAWTADGKKLIASKITNPRWTECECVLLDPATGQTEPFDIPANARVMDCGPDGKTSFARNLARLRALVGSPRPEEPPLDQSPRPRGG